MRHRQGGPAGAVVTRAVQSFALRAIQNPRFFPRLPFGVRRRAGKAVSQGTRQTTAPCRFTGAGARQTDGFGMDVYRVIAERIIEKLEQGTVPWHKSWQSMGAPNSCLPRRLCGAPARCRVGTPRAGPKLAATTLRGCGLVLRAHFAVRKEFESLQARGLQAERRLAGSRTGVLSSQADHLVLPLKDRFRPAMQ